MIITKPKEFKQILEMLKGANKIFLVGCNECSATCKTGGEPELQEMKKKLEAEGKTVTASVLPNAPCVAAQVKIEYAKNMKALRESDAILVLACGLGVQSAKNNDRLGLSVFPANDTVFTGALDATGEFLELCSACGECILDLTGGICPITRCSKGLLIGPCGGMNKGKCEVDKEQDCAWVLIYKELEKKGKLEFFKKIQAPKDFSKTRKPHKLKLEAKSA